MLNSRLLHCDEHKCEARVEAPTQRSDNFQGKKKHINMNKFAGLSGTGWVPNIFFHSLWGEKTRKQNPPKHFPGQSREMFASERSRG